MILRRRPTDRKNKLIYATVSPSGETRLGRPWVYGHTRPCGNSTVFGLHTFFSPNPNRQAGHVSVAWICAMQVAIFRNLHSMRAAVTPITLSFVAFRHDQTTLLNNCSRAGALRVAPVTS